MLIAALAVSLAAACFSDVAGSESTPTSDTDITQADATPLTPESLLAELRSHGMEFEYEGFVDGWPYSQMNGFVHREGVTGDFRWGEEILHVHEFTGPGEALVAASRISRDGTQATMPAREHDHWISGGGYGPPAPLYHFLSANIIAVFLGDNEEVPSVLKELMGEPFAGTMLWSGEIRPEDKFSKFEHIWLKQDLAAEFISAEKLGSRSGGSAYRIKYRFYSAHSFACSGQSHHGLEIADDEVRLTLFQRTLDTDAVEMIEPCELEWRWAEVDRLANDLIPGQTYNVFINGEQVAEFTAG